jgi:FkbM family methyltransferase
VPSPWDVTLRQVWTGIDRRLRPRRHADPEPEWLTVKGGPLRGAQLFLAPSATDTWRSMVEGTADAPLFDALCAVRRPDGLVFWDVGGHFGYHALAFASLAGATGRVVAFEPAPANLDRFKLHLARNPSLAGRVDLIEAALSNTPGQAEFVAGSHAESGESSGSHLAGVDTPSDASAYRRFQRVRIIVDTADRIIESGRAPAPDVVKIDVEGAEDLVLEGARNLLRDRHPLLLMEVHHILQMAAVQARLAAADYKIEVLDRARATPSRCFIIGR